MHRLPQSFTPPRSRHAAAKAAAVAFLATITAGLMISFSSAGATASATVAQLVPAPDPRFVEGNPTTCAEAGLTGTLLFGDGDASYPQPPTDAGDGTVSADGTVLDVTVNAGFTATGIVVKGGPDANAYDGPFTGPILVEDMVSPPVGQGNIPEISHWFVCGDAAAPTPSASVTPSVTPHVPPSSTPSPSASTSTASPSPSASTSTASPSPSTSKTPCPDKSKSPKPHHSHRPTPDPSTTSGSANRPH